MTRPGPAIIELTLKASAIVRVLDLALAGVHPSTIASRTGREEVETRAILKAHGWPQQADMTAMRDDLALLRHMSVCFDVEPYRPTRSAGDRTPVPCDFDGCDATLATHDSYVNHQRQQHGIRRKPGRPARKDVAA